MRNDNVVFFPRSVKGEAAKLRFNIAAGPDAAGRVSIFPIVPCANTNVPTIMTAEKIADATIAGH